MLGLLTVGDSTTGGDGIQGAQAGQEELTFCSWDKKRHHMSGGQAHNPCYLESEAERAQIQDLPGVHREFKGSLFETLSQNKQASKQTNQKQADE